jgi:hypothetical protein
MQYTAVYSGLLTGDDQLNVSRAEDGHTKNCDSRAELLIACSEPTLKHFSDVFNRRVMYTAVFRSMPLTAKLNRQYWSVDEIFYDADLFVRLSEKNVRELKIKLASLFCLKTKQEAKRIPLSKLTRE